MQRRDFSRQLAGASLGLAVASVVQAQGAPKEGTHYVRLSTAAPVAPFPADKKIDVVEFFWYGCPHCYAFEPILDAWAKKLPADVGFRRIPVGFAAPHQLHQKLFYALEEANLLASLHSKVFHAYHKQNQRLNSPAEIVAFANANGADGAKLGEALKSFNVNTKSNRARQLTDAYKIDGVPALGINGRFYTSAALSGSHERAVAVADFLIQLSRQ